MVNIHNKYGLSSLLCFIPALKTHCQDLHQRNSSILSYVLLDYYYYYYYYYYYIPLFHFFLLHFHQVNTYQSSG